jgi:hypothetical protein
MTIDVHSISRLSGSASLAQSDRVMIGSYSGTIGLAGLMSATMTSPGTSGVYAPGDTVTLTGGTPSTRPVLTITTTKVVSATVAAGGSGGSNGAQTVTGTTGTGTKFQASVTVSGGAIASVGSITVAGSYTVNPTAPATEPVTGGSVTGGQLDVVIGIATYTITTPGTFTALPGSGALTQYATSGGGSGSGATFTGTSWGYTVAFTGEFPASYAVVATTDQDAVAYVPTSSKTSAGFSAVIKPRDTTGVLVAGTVTALVFA